MDNLTSVFTIDRIRARTRHGSCQVGGLCQHGLKGQHGWLNITRLLYDPFVMGVVAVPQRHQRAGIDNNVAFHSPKPCTFSGLVDK